MDVYRIILIKVSFFYVTSMVTRIRTKTSLIFVGINVRVFSENHKLISWVNSTTKFTKIGIQETLMKPHCI